VFTTSDKFDRDVDERNGKTVALPGGMGSIAFMAGDSQIALRPTVLRRPPHAMHYKLQAGQNLVPWKYTQADNTREAFRS